MRNIFHICTVLLILLLLGMTTASATQNVQANLTEGIYGVEASLSCYVNAMGGIEFGASLLESAQVQVDSDGRKTITLFFTKSSVTIYGVTCDTFIDVSPSYVTETNGVRSGTIGFYDETGLLNTQDVEYALSDDTAQNARGEQIHYVSSLSFPVACESETYNISLFINSNVMGTQFTADGYRAVVTVNWSSAARTDQDAPKKTDCETAENATRTDNVESKSGMNIYRPDDKADHGTETSVSETLAASFRKPVLIAAVAVSGSLVLTGAVLIIAGRREKRS